MSAENLARRAWADITFQGVSITNSIRPYFLSLTYTDNEDGEADDLQIRLQDQAQIWQEKWLEDMVNAAASGSFKIKADIVIENWKGGGRDSRLPCGEFAAWRPPARPRWWWSRPRLCPFPAPSVRRKKPKPGRVIPSPASPIRWPGRTV